MKLNIGLGLILLLFTALGAAMSTPGQTPQMVKKKTTKTDRFDFGSGGTITINGAPQGSIKIIGTAKNEIEITAEIEVEAPSETELAELAEATGFITDESSLHTTINTIGNHNKFGLKKLPKKFPKYLLGLPFTVNYVINVPHYTDLDIDGGKGDLTIENVEGTLSVKFIESNAKVEIAGGASTSIIIGKGSAEIDMGARGWRGRGADIQLASGDLTVRMPLNLSANVDATIIKTGSIKNTFPNLKPRERKVLFTERSIIAKAGVGGSPLKFTVGDGTLSLEPTTRVH